MLDAQVLAESLRTKPAFETDKMIVVHRSPNRHCWHKFRCSLLGRSAKPRQRLPDNRDDRSELIGVDIVAPHIGGDDARDQVGMLSSAMFNHSPCASIASSISERQQTPSGTLKCGGTNLKDHKR